MAHPQIRWILATQRDGMPCLKTVVEMTKDVEEAAGEVVEEGAEQVVAEGAVEVEAQEEWVEEEEEELAEVVEELSEDMKQADGGARDDRAGGLGRSILGDKLHLVIVDALCGYD